ncbi:hypothetical protein A7U60_g4793 [Sanghuangporus baumii]|uniref:BTB domain-containing protein n=1 Tax=Sanghuangporus baumii TaxID=108892 RepID=A0A9Q5N8T2_SANBA|nr:hypothetical protein A7U60_g4793 [Sanghuangporus baumii]
MTEDSARFKSSWLFGIPVEAPCSVPGIRGDAIPEGSRTPSCHTSRSPSTKPFECSEPESESGISTEINNLNKASSTEIILTDNDLLPTTSGKQRDEQFYYTLITFEVENILFRVPRRPFEIESSVFKEMFELPSDGSSDGNTDEKPLALSGITVESFRAFLRVLFDSVPRRPFEIESSVFKEMFELPSDGSSDGNTDEKPLALSGITVESFRAFLRVLFDPAYGLQSELQQDEWISVLQLSHMWSCDRLFALAISKLSVLEVDPILKIMLAKTYNIEAWLPPAYFSLVTRAEPLTLEDAEKLGMETTMKLTEVRESRYRWIIDDLEEPRPQPVVYSSFPFGNPNKKGKKSARGRSPINFCSVKKDVSLLDGDVRYSIKQIFGL